MTPTRRSILVATVLVWSLWIAGMVSGNRWSLFADDWFMSVTMMVGAFVAGSTSEGGGAVAFPVMTLMFGIAPAIARDFSLMVQSIGMTSASATILYTRIPVEQRALVWSSLGGLVGIVLGLEVISPWLAPEYTKMTFLAIWLAFAFALFWINRYHDREVMQRIERFGKRHAVMLVGVGLLGGMVSGIAGSGLDIVTFSLLVLRFRIDEKVATPTSVVLMGINTVVGFAWKGGLRPLLDPTFPGMAPDAWDFWWVCVPVVVVMAPAGARFIRDRSRQFVAQVLYVAIAVQFICGLLIIPQTPLLLLHTAAVFLAALILFRAMANGGVRRLEWLASLGRGDAGATG